MSVTLALPVTKAKLSNTSEDDLVKAPANGHTRNGYADRHGEKFLSRGKSGWNLDAAGRFKDFPKDVSQLLIPAFAGASTRTNAIQRLTKLRYLAVLLLATIAFYSSSNPRLRTAAISLIFPGAGFLAVGGIGGTLAFIFTVALLPLCLFAWFGSGAIFFPIADWVLSGILATHFANSTIVESSAVMTLGLVAVIYTYFQTRSDYEGIADRKLRDRRNTYLESLDKSWQSESVTGTADGTRELSLEQLRFVQHIIELASKDINDWSEHTIIDQFQPAALRYQLYEFVNCLALYQCIYAPNFHGYVSAAMRNAIEKSLTPKVLNFWKWESLLGKFTTNYDPVIKDNIMVTGFLALSIGLYQSNTGDDRYSKKGALNMQITDKISYKHDLHSLYNALVANWDGSKFTLYPCEPNWIYSMCNLYGMSAAFVYDRLYEKNNSSRLMGSFYRHFEEDFFTAGGSCIPIKSSLTGFTIPGLCGITGDCANATFCSPIMPTLAKRMWLITREENMHYDENGKVVIRNLRGADLIDGGNYKPAKYGPYAIFAPAAAEWGDEDIAKECLNEVDELAGVEVNPATGAKQNKGVSVINKGILTRSRMMKGGDWGRTVTHGPPENALRGPILDRCSYPEVLVAKAYSHTSKDLDLVLYPGIKAGRFEISISRLRPGGKYMGQESRPFQADGLGNAKLEVRLNGRTQIHIQPTT